MSYRELTRSQLIPNSCSARAPDVRGQENRSFGLASLKGNSKIANNFGITKFPENVKAPHDRKFSALSVGVFTFSGSLVILKLLAIFYSTCRLARPNCLFLALGRSGGSRGFPA